MPSPPRMNRITALVNGLFLWPQHGHSELRWRFTLPSLSDLVRVWTLAPQPISVLIAESNPELLLKFATAIGQDQGLSLIAAVSTGAAAMVFAEQRSPDVLLLDLALIDAPAIDVIRQLAWNHHGTAIVVLAQLGNDEQIAACIEAGASGYFFNDLASDDLVARIHGLRARGAPVSPGRAWRTPTIRSSAAQTK